MVDDPVPDTEYTLIRAIESRLHVVSFLRYPDDSGIVRHGEYSEQWEFNLNGLLDSWRVLHDVGWTIEESMDRPSCGCKWFDYDKLFEFQDAGLAIEEVNRQWREYCRPISEFHDRILWGG